MGTSFYPVSDLDTSANGSNLVTVSTSSTSFTSTVIGSTGMPVKFYASQANTVAGKHIRFVNNQLVVVANNSGFTTYKVVSSGAYTKYKTFNLAISDLESDGSNYFYILDSANRIISFEASAYEVAQLGAVELPSKVLSFALSSEYFLVVMENLKLNVYGIIRNAN